MTTTARGGKGKAAQADFEDATCQCGRAVMAVMVAASRVLVDRDADAGGEIAAMKYGGRTVFTTANTDGFSGPQMRYRRHRCPVTMQSDLRRRLDHLDTIGPCRRCHTRNAARPYGPNPKLFCDACETATDPHTGS